MTYEGSVNCNRNTCSYSRETRRTSWSNFSETFTDMIMLAQLAMLCYVKIFWGGFHNFLNIIGWKFSLRFVQYEFWLRWWNIFGRLRDFIIRRKMIVVGILPEDPCLFRHRVRGGGKAWGSMLWWQTQGWWLMRLVLNEMFGQLELVLARGFGVGCNCSLWQQSWIL